MASPQPPSLPHSRSTHISPVLAHAEHRPARHPAPLPLPLPVSQPLPTHPSAPSAYIPDPHRSGEYRGHSRRPSSHANRSPGTAVSGRERERAPMEYAYEDERRRRRDSERSRDRERTRRELVDWRTQPASPPQPLSSSRMSLSALVNSPPPPPGSLPGLPGSPPRGAPGSGRYRSPSFTPPPLSYAHSHSHAHPRPSGAHDHHSIAHVRGHREREAYDMALPLPSGSRADHRRGSIPYSTDSALGLNPAGPSPSMSNGRTTRASPPLNISSTSLDYTPESSHARVFYHSGPPPSFPPSPNPPAPMPGRDPLSARSVSGTSAAVGSGSIPLSGHSRDYEFRPDRERERYLDRERERERERYGYPLAPSGSGAAGVRRSSIQSNASTIPYEYDHAPHAALSHRNGGRGVRDAARIHGTSRGNGGVSNYWDEANGHVGANGGADADEEVAYRLGDRLLGSEDVWEEALKGYQMKREREVGEIVLLDTNTLPTRNKPGPKQSARKSTQTASASGSTPTPSRPSETASDLPSLASGEVKPYKKPRGFPADHPARIAARQAKEAAIAAGLPIPTGFGGGRKGKKAKAKADANAAAASAVEDELLGLAEGEGGRSSPVPGSVGEWADDDGPSTRQEDDEEPPAPIGPDTIVHPCGLTRAALIAKLEAGDMDGLTEIDVKAVQDEMWVRSKETAGGGGVGIRKDGTLRRKPGPAKGWKQLRGEAAPARRVKPKPAAGLGGASIGGGAAEEGSSEYEVDFEGSSAMDEAEMMGLNEGAMPRSEGGAEGDIAALMDYGGGKNRGVKRKRTMDGGEEVATDDDRSVLAAGDDDRGDRRSSVFDMDDAQSVSGPTGGATGRRGKGGKGGRGRWSRPGQVRGERDSAEGTIPVEDLLGMGTGAEGYELQGESSLLDLNTNLELAPAKGAVDVPLDYPPNSEDPRGVSEVEAKVRFGLVEDLQKTAWAAIVRDVPRVYRVYQGYDTIAKQDKARVSQACMRNAFAQRAMKPTFKSAARINKDAISKSKRVIKEMLLYWRKNEKEELAARKKAEKETLEKAKAEEEAREAKRQSRKLNFLLTQTELYSHFIGKKIKTAEAERPDGDTGGTVEEKEREGRDDLGLDDSGEPLPDIDYDDDDEDNLRRHAARGAQAAVQAARDKARAFDEAMPGAKKKDEQLQDIDLDGDELNFQNPSLGADAIVVTQPKMLMAQLKEYQLKGLTWLGNLYEQGINGILADEMGLGKTIQSISLLAFLAEHHNLWGPFLVIAPSSTLHNWQQELARFVPRLKALPYWGSPKDRETLRRIWSRKNMTFDEDSPFHILVTSYQLAVQDDKYLQGVKWQYMILDEAQAIKSSSSARWKSLLSLPCRNRLLLTGTPIQNSMHELWALLHFIMPSLFDSHEEFSEWFSKDIENAAGGGSGTLKPEQLRRLHMILKPFMLRRVKKHVQKELGDKIEIDVLVDLSQRQRAIYKALRQRVSISDLISQANNANDSLGAKNLMNLVMQFRKVCNHPDLFERADVVSPLMFGTFSQSNLSRESEGMYLPDSGRNAIQPELPRLLWSEKLDRPAENSSAGGKEWVVRNLMSIWSPEWVGRRLQEETAREESWGWAKIQGLAAGQVIEEDAAGRSERAPFESDPTFAASAGKDFSLAPLPLGAAFGEISKASWTRSFLSRPEARFSLDRAVAPLIRPIIHDRSYINSAARCSTDSLARTALYGLVPSEVNNLAAVSRLHHLLPGLPPSGLLAASPLSQLGNPRMLIPPTKRLIVDSAKLARLDELLRELKDGGHRVLLYFQMTKMMDLVEEYLVYRQYKYLRLDGGSAIGDRRDMVTSWQTNPEIFVFCLSTRAGGLGINLTAADTVVFYDHDWNPSNDAQAMDRAHRVGQTKQVTVYRLIARGTIEERIVKLARAKKDVQDIVVGTKSLTDVAKPSEIVSLFMDDEELAESVAKRKQAEAHGYVAPSTAPSRPRSAFGDGLGNADDDEDDFFSMKRQVPNGEDEDFGDEASGAAVGGGGGGGAKGGKDGKGTPKKKSGGSKRKAAPAGEGEGGGGGEGAEKKPPAKKKKVKIALGPDGLPI